MNLGTVPARVSELPGARNEERNQRSMRNHHLAVIAILTLGVSQANALTASYQTDFDIASGNPDGLWTYGYTTTLGGTLNLHTTTISNSQTHLWYTPGLSGDATPSNFRNVGGPVNNIQTNEAGMHTGPGGQMAVARLTSNENTAVTIVGKFGQGDIGGVGSYILHNGVQIFGVTNSGVDENFSLAANLAVGDTLDFVITTGDGSYAFDSTPLYATVQSVPEPTTLALGGLMLAALARRRRR